MIHNYIPLLASINPQNVVNITLALFYITGEEVKHKYSTVALYLMGKLIKRYQNTIDGKLTPKKAKTLVRAARAVVAILKPKAVKNIKKYYITT
jgi:hypothetical protein